VFEFENGKKFWGELLNKN